MGDKIKDACRKEYPRIESDLNVQPADKGLIAFMADHLVDFDFLQDSAEQPSSHENAPPLNVDEGKDENPGYTLPLLPTVTSNTTPHEKPLSV